MQQPATARWVVKVVERMLIAVLLWPLSFRAWCGWRYLRCMPYPATPHTKTPLPEQNNDRRPPVQPRFSLRAHLAVGGCFTYSCTRTHSRPARERAVVYDKGEHIRDEDSLLIVFGCAPFTARDVPDVAVPTVCGLACGRGQPLNVLHGCIAMKLGSIDL